MRKNRFLLLFFLFLSVIIYTVAYSGLATELSVTSSVKFRPIVDIRVEDITLKNASEGATVQYEPNLWEPDWNVAKTITGFKLPSSTSSITYEVTVTNYGDVDQCIYSTSINDNTVNYEITGYTIKDIIGFGETKKFYITFTTTNPSEETKNIVVDYEFRKVFRVEYNANGGTNAPAMQRKYEREDLTLTTDTPSYTGNRFLGWSAISSDSSIQYQPGGTFTLDQDTILYAKWGQAVVNIGYNLNGGTLSDQKGANVTADGQTILVDGSANIHTIPIGGSLPSGGLMDYNNPTGINIVKNGYHAASGAEFRTSSGTTYDQTTIYTSSDFTSVTDDNTDLVLYVNWEPTGYTLTYDLDGGQLEQGVTNPSAYNIETPSFTLNNPSKDGYTFIGWSEGQETPEVTKTIAQGTTGNKTLTANYQVIDYDITYIYNDGELPTGVTNPSTYNIESGNITINNPSKVGYTFTGWTDQNSVTPVNPYVIASGSTGNLTLTANYEVQQLTVTYMDGETEYDSETVIYGNTATAPSTNPTREHNIFLGWTLNNSAYDFTTPVTTDLTLYSSYETVERPTITHTPTSWTNQNVTMTISSSHNDYTYMYKIDNGSYVPYNSPVTITQNCTVTAYSIKNGVTSLEQVHVIDNIDKIDPTITTLEEGNVLSTSFDINIESYDLESGLSEIRIYKDNSYVTTISYSTNPNETKSSTYTFENLVEGTTYTIKVVAVDIAGNETTSEEIEVTTSIVSRIVARLIGYNNTSYSEDDCEEDEGLCITFPTLKSALEYTGDLTTSDDRNCLLNQCTIQMLDDVRESNTVLDGQEITLDLNGHTINGKRDYTFSNNGDFKVIDSVEYSETPEDPTTDKYVQTGLLLQLDGIEHGESAGNWVDLTNNYTGSISGASWNSDNNGLVFDGTNDYVMIDQINPETITLETTFKLDKYGSQFIFGNFEAGGYGIYINASKQLVVSVYVDGGYKTISMPNVQLDTIYTVALTYDLENIIMYVNGSQYGDPISINPENNAIVAPTKNTYTAIGTNPVRNEPYNQYFGGTVYSARIYNEALTSSEISNNYEVDYARFVNSARWYNKVSSNLNGIKNGVDTAIINTGKLTIGDGQFDSGSDVSLYKPYIEGSTYGINNINGDEFYFFDGRIVGTTAINGDVTDTTYMYSTNVQSITEENNTYQVATLRILSNVEARIGSKYYTKVANAVADAKNGQYVDILTNDEFMDSFDKEGTFGFVKDGNFLVNENTAKGSYATSSMILDLDAYEEDQLLTVGINKVISSSSSYDGNTGTIYIYEGTDNTGTLIDTINVPKGESVQNVILPAGHKYYVKLYFSIYSSDSYPSESKMYITDMHLKDYEIETPSQYEDLETTTERVTYGFDYDQTTGSWTSNNQYTEYTKAFGYYEVDLTNTSIDKKLILSATLSTYGSSNYGNVIISTTNDVRQGYNNYDSGAFVYMNGYNSSGVNLVGPQVYSTTLAAGQKYYIQFYYFKSNNSGPSTAAQYEQAGCKDQFIINSLEVIDDPLIKGEEQLLDVSDKLVQDTTGFEYYSGSGASSQYRSTRYTTEISHTYFEADLTNNTSDKYLNVTYSYKYINSSAYYYAVVTDSPNLPTYDSTTAFMYGGNSSITQVNKTATLVAGRKNYVHFVYNPNGGNDSYYFTFGSIKISSVQSIDLANDIITPAGEYGFLNGGSYIYKDSNARTNQVTAHSYFTVDLRGDNDPKHLEMEQSSLYGDFVVKITDSATTPTDMSNYAYKVEDTNSRSGNALINLKPNQINYVHLMSPYVSTTSYDNIRINSIKIANGYAYDLSKELKTSSGSWNYGGFTKFYSYYNAYMPDTTYSTAPSDSYVVVDLRNSSYDKLISLSAKMHYSSYQYIYVSDSEEAVNYGPLSSPTNYSGRSNLINYFTNSSSGGYARKNNSSPSDDFYDFDFVLAKGRKYYLHFGYCPQNSSYPYLRSIIMKDVKSYDTKTGLQDITYGTGSGGPSSHTGPTVEGAYKIGDTNQTDLRFIGANPQNYISFNNELWRIVGVYDTEDENGVTKPRIKIVKNDGIGSLSGDSSDESVNSGYGINEWSQEDIMKLMNPGYDTNSEEVVVREEKYSHTSNIGDDGTQNGNYGNSWTNANITGTDRGSTSEAHVISFPGATSLHVKIVYAGESANYDWVCMWVGSYPSYNAYSNYGSSITGKLGGSQNTWEQDVTGDTVTFAFRSDSSGWGNGYGYYAVVSPVGATEQTEDVLVNNSLYWNRASGKCMTNSKNTMSNCDFSTRGLTADARQYVDTVKWYTAAVPIGMGGLTASQVYDLERGTNTSKTNYTARGEGIDDTVTRTTSWLGKVGLLYPSDYIYASSDYVSGSTVSASRSSCLNNPSNYGACMYYADWLSNTGGNTRLITPTYNNLLDYTTVGTQSSFSYMPLAVASTIKPTLYLSTKTVITGGDGTPAVPYTIGLGSTDNAEMNNYYGLLPEEEEEEDTSPQGSIINTITDDYKNMKDEPIYGFEYDTTNDYYYSNNYNTGASTALSYIVVDRTSESEDIDIKINYDLSSSNGTGYVFILENSYDNNIDLNNQASYDNYKYFAISSTGTDSQIVTLKAETKYYIAFGFNKYNTNRRTSEIREDFRVSIDGLVNTTPSSIVTKYNGQGPQLNSEVDTVQILKDISLPDVLTIEDTKDMIFDLNGYTLTTSNNNYLFNNSGSLKIIDTGINRKSIIADKKYEADMAAYSEDMREVVAEHNEYNASLSELTANDYVTDGLVSNGVTPRETTGPTNNLITVYDATGVTNTSAFTYEMVVSNLANSSNIFANVCSASHSVSNSIRYVSANCTGTSGSFNSKPIPASTNIISITLSYDGEYLKVYYNGKLYDQRAMSSVNTPSSSAITMFPYGQGVAHTFRAYSRALTEEEVINNFNVDNVLYEIEPVETKSINDKNLITDGYDMYPVATAQTEPNTFKVSAPERSYYNPSYIAAPLHFDSPFSTVSGTIEIGYNVTDTFYNYYFSKGELIVGLVKDGFNPNEDIFSLYSSTSGTVIFDSYEKLNLEKNGSRSIDFELKPTTLGTYHLVVLFKGVFSSSTSNMGYVLYKNVKFSYEEPQREIATYDGNLTATTNSAIINNEGAYLDVDEAIINVNSSGKSGILNYGTLTLGEHAVVNAVSGAYGVYNYSTGNIEDGEATFNGPGTAIQSVSDVDSGFGGYTFNDTLVLMNNTVPVTLSDITGTGTTEIRKTTGSDLTIEDSDFVYLHNYNGSSRNITINNSTGKVYNEIGTITVEDSTLSELKGYSSTGTINNSTITDLLGYGNFSINNSTINKIDTSSNIGYYNINNSTINNYIYSENDIILRGQTVVNGYVKNTKSLTIGEDDGTVSTTYPRIYRPTSTPVYSLSTFNFYDGAIIGLEDKVINGNVTGTPTGYNITSSKEDTVETYTLSNENVCAIGNTGYATIQDAIDSIQTSSETEIDLLVDLKESNSVTVPANRNIKLDYNGHKVMTYATTWITNNGTLTMYDSKSAGIDNETYSQNFIINNGTLNYDNVRTVNRVKYDLITNNGTLNMTAGLLKVPMMNSCGIKNYLIVNNSVVNMSGGSILGYQLINNPSGSTFTVTGGTLSHYLYVNNYCGDGAATGVNGISNSGTLSIKDANIKDIGGSSNYMIKNEASGTATIDNITTYLISYSLYNTSGSVYPTLLNNSGTATIKNINDQSFYFLYYNYSGATLEILDSDINIKNVRSTNNGTLTITNSDISSDIALQYSTGSSASTTINSSTLNGYLTTTSTSSNHLMDVVSGANIEINDSTIINNKTSNTSGVYTINSSGASHITVTGNSEIDGKNTTAIRTSGASIITIGEEGNGVSSTYPYIKGYPNGIYSSNSSSELYFYDGRIGGSTNNSISAVITEIEEGYDIITTTPSSGREEKFLSNSLLVRNLTTNEDYGDIQLAITEATSGDTLQMIRNLTTLSSYTTIEIPTGKSIVFDMNGKSILQNGTSGPLFLNNGTFTIKDDNGTSSLITNNTSNSVITNNGTLNVNFIAVNNKIADTNIIDNSSTGTVVITNANITLTAKGRYTNAGIMTINNTDMYTNTSAGGQLYNSGTMTINNIKFNMTCDENSYSTRNLGTISNTGTINIHGGGLYGTITNSSSSTMTIDQNNAVTIIKGTLYVNNTSTLNFNSGTLYDNLILNNDGIINMAGGVLRGTATVNNAGVFTMTGGAINNSSNSSSAALSVYNNSAQVTIAAGTIYSYTTTAIYTNNRTTPIIIGEQGNGVSTTSPSINSRNKRAIEGNIYFYDGVISIGVESQESGSVYKEYMPPVSEDITVTESGYNVVVEGNSIHLSSNPIIKNVTKDISYTSLKQAFDDASNNDSLQMLQGYLMLGRDDIAEVSSGKTLSLNLNGKSIYSYRTVISNSGTLNISDSETTGLISYRDGNVITSSGTLNISSGVYEGTIASSGQMNVTGGTFRSTISNTGTLSYDGGLLEGGEISNSGTTVIDSGTTARRSNSPATITNNVGGTLTINDLTTPNDNYNNKSTKINNHGTMTMAGGTYQVYTGDNDALVSNDGTFNYTGGAITTYFFINNQTGGIANISNLSNSNTTILKLTTNSGTMTISGITYTFDNPYSISSSGTLNINNSTLSYVKTTNGSPNATTLIYVTGGTTTINNSTISNSIVDSSENLIKLFEVSSGATLDIKDGSSINNYNGANGIAVYSYGTVILGSKDGVYYSSSPLVKGSTYGINNTGSGVIRFFDGTISGGTAAVHGRINEVETDYVVDINTVDNYQNATLRIPGENERVIIMNNINYTTLDAAISAAPADSTSDMVLYVDYTLTNNIIVPSGKTINLYLNGHTLNNDIYTITGSFNTISGTPAGASILSYLFNNNSSNTKSILLLVLIIILSGLVVVYKKKKL